MQPPGGPFNSAESYACTSTNIKGLHFDTSFSHLPCETWDVITLPLSGDFASVVLNGYHL